MFSLQLKINIGLDFCPAFWDWLILENTAGKLFSIDKVKNEIVAGADELSKWSKSQSKNFFLSLDRDNKLQSALSEVSNWVYNNYKQNEGEIHKFFQTADYYLIAQARISNFTIVTHEKLGKSPYKIKIPNVCDGLKIKYIDPFQMLRLEGAQFILKQVQTKLDI
jgi:hypothetical protein